VLHPGKMGAALAMSVEGDVLWASAGRSRETAGRAMEAGIADVGSQEALMAVVDVLVSVCPPAVALEVARQVDDLGFDGLFVDVNAVSPATARHMDHLFTRFVDGGVVGPPPTSTRPRSTLATRPDTPRTQAGNHSRTRLYLSGEEADTVASLFTGSSVECRVIGSEAGRASALKMAYAAWTKGTSALLLSVAALATSEEVIEELLSEWDLSIPELRERLERVSMMIGDKAWRFVGEMEEIAQTYGDSGLPEEFHLAAAEIYSHLAHLKDQPPGRLPGEVSEILLGRAPDQSAT